MDWLNGTVHMPGMKTGLWLGNFPNILSEIFALKSTITVCHPSPYHTICFNAQEQTEKLLELWWGSLHTISHLIFILYILFSLLYINCLFQLHIFYTLGWHSVTYTHKYMAINGTKKFKSKMHNVVKLTHVLGTVYKACFGDCFQNVVLQWNKTMGSVQCMCQLNSTS